MIEVALDQGIRRAAVRACVRLDGLQLVGGSVDCNEAINRFLVGPSAAGSAGTTEVSVLMENGAPVEGYTVALCHAPSVTRLLTVEPGRAALAATWLSFCYSCLPISALSFVSLFLRFTSS